jgi:Fibronectin type III domain
MSEQAAEASAPPRKGRGQKKILGLPMPVALGAGAGVLALAYLWWRSRKKSAAATTSAATTSSTSSGTSDAQLASELQQLLDDQGGYGSGGGGGGYGGGGITSTSTGTHTTTKTTTGTTSKTTSGTTSKTTNKTTSSTSTKTPVVRKPMSAPGRVGVRTTPTSAVITWGPLSRATSYRVRVEHGTGLVHGGAVSSTTTTVSGLKPKTNYRVRIAGINSAGEGPWSAPTYFETS